MKNTTYQIRFLILDNENNVLKNFILAEREYDTREEAAEAAQTVCCVLMNYCGRNVFYRIVKPVVDYEGGFYEITADGSIVSDEEEAEEEDENYSHNELTGKEINAILKQAHDIVRKRYENK